MGEFDVVVEDIFSDGHVSQEVRSISLIGEVLTFQASLVHVEVEKDRCQKERD